MVDIDDMRSVREEVGKLIKDIQEMENATNKLLESLMNAISATGDMDSVSEKGYLMTLAQMQAVNNTVLCRSTKLLTLIVMWYSRDLERRQNADKKSSLPPGLSGIEGISGSLPAAGTK